MKKVLFFVESLAGGGAEKVLLTLIKNLDKTKYDITVFTVVKTGVYVEEFEKNCRVLCALDNYSNLNFLQKIMYRVKNKLIYKLDPKYVYKKLVKDSYDIEVAFVEGFDTKIISSSSNANSKKYAWVHTNMVTNPHADIHYQNLNEQKEFYGRYDGIFAVSNDVKNAFVQKFGLENISIQYNPVDSNEILEKSNENELEIEKDKINFITIGRLTEQKGYIRLLKIVKLLVDMNYNFNLNILGTGEQKQELECYIKENNLNSAVKLLGFQTNPYKYLAKSDCFICSSYSEGFSTVATESMILNIPIVTTKCSGMEELFGNYKCGIITENTDEGLFNGLKEILDNPELLSEYRLEINKRKHYFDIKNRIIEIEEILDE